MSKKKKVIATTGLASLVASVGIVGSAEAAVGDIQAKIDQLRSNRGELSGNLLTQAALASSSRVSDLDYGQTYGQTYNQTYNQTYTQSYTEHIENQL